MNRTYHVCQPSTFNSIVVIIDPKKDRGKKISREGAEERSKAPAKR